MRDLRGLQRVTRGSLKALATLIFLALMWGYNWVVMKNALQFAGPFDFGALRAVLGALVLFAVGRLTGRSMRLEQPAMTFWLGLLQTTGFVAFSNWALVEGGAGRVAILAYTMPFWVLLFAWPLLGERLSRLQWLAAAAAAAGLLLILAPWQSYGTLFSKLLAVLAGASWGASAIIAKKIQRRGQTELLALTAWQMLLGGLALSGVAWLVDERTIVWTPYLTGALLYNVVLASALGWLIWLYLVRTLTAGMAGLSVLCTPVVGVLAAAWEHGEIPNVPETAGIVTILGALALLSWANSRASDRGKAAGA